MSNETREGLDHGGDMCVCVCGRIAGYVQGSVFILTAIESHWCDLIGGRRRRNSTLRSEFRDDHFGCSLKTISTSPCWLQLCPGSFHSKDAATRPWHA